MLLFLILFSNILGANENLEQERKRLSQQEGYAYARELYDSNQKMDLDAVIEGIRQYAHQKAPASDMTEEEANEQYSRRWVLLYEEQAEENLTQANSFLKEIAEKPSVTVLEGGKLAYEIVETGTGEDCVQNVSSPLLHYAFKTLGGKEIVTTHTQQTPIRVPLTEVIQGFAKGVVGMRKGEKRKLYIHPQLAYGKASHLPPNVLLIGEVELVDF